MALELFFTSAESGLNPNSTGFCTVATTAGMATTMVRKLEALGGYRVAFDDWYAKGSLNPRSFAHYVVSIGGQRHDVLSHVRYAGADHDGRFNKLAHHVVLETGERCSAGPAWVMMQPGVMAAEWSGPSRVLPHDKVIPQGSSSLRTCQAWQKVAGDAGWAGMLANAFILDASRPAYVIYKPGMDLLPLIDEAIALLPEHARWRVTFNTYFDTVPAGLSCAWRCCLTNTPAAANAPGNATSGVIIDLTKPLGEAPDNKYVRMARTGKPAEETGSESPIVASGTTVDVRSPVTSDSVYDLMEPDLPELAQMETSTSTPASRAPTSRSHPAYARSPNRTPIFWAAVLLWPILVLAIGGALFWGKFTEIHDSLVASQEDAKQLTEQLTQAGEKVDAQQRDIQKHNETIKGLKGTVAVLEDERRGQETEIAQLNRDLTDARNARPEDGGGKGLDTTPTDGGEVAAANDGEEGGGGDQEGDGPAAPPSADPVEVTPIVFLGEDSAAAVGGGGDRTTLAEKIKICLAPEGVNKIEATFPVDETKADLGNIEIGSDQDMFRMSYKATTSFAIEETVLIGEILIEEGYVVWHGKETVIKAKNDDVEKAETLQTWLRYATLSMQDTNVAKDPTTHQFIVAEKVTLGLAEKAKLVASATLDIPFDICSPCFSVGIGSTKPTGAWETDASPLEGKDTLILKSKSGVQLTVSIRKATGDEEGAVLEAKWNKDSSPEELTEAIEKLAKEAGGKLVAIGKSAPEKLKDKSPSEAEAKEMTIQDVDKRLAKFLPVIQDEIDKEAEDSKIAEAERNEQATEKKLRDALLSLLKAVVVNKKSWRPEIEKWEKKKDGLLVNLESRLAILKRILGDEKNADLRDAWGGAVKNCEGLQSKHNKAVAEAAKKRNEASGKAWRELRKFKEDVEALRKKLTGPIKKTEELTMKRKEAGAPSSIPVTVKAKRSGAILAEVNVKVGVK